jgi:adenylate cyclase
MWLWKWTICDLHNKLAQWDQAVAPCQLALAANPKNFFAHIDLAAAYGWLRREAEAKAEIAESLKLVPGFTVKRAIAYASNVSDNPVYVQQNACAAEGMRKVGLPEE